GAGDRGMAIRVTNQAILWALFLGLAGSAAGLLGVDGLVHFLRLHGEAAELAAAYLAPLFLLLVFQVVEAPAIPCLAGAGDTRMGLWIAMGVAAINLPLAWGFYLLGSDPVMRFVGISVGTGVSHVLGGLAVLFALARGRAGLGFRVRWLWPDWGLLRRL